MTILIAGGGIGGLTAALSLHAAGIADVEVVEASPRIEPVGVGINLPPHATRELVELGFADVLAKIGMATTYLSYFDPAGNLIWAEPRGIVAGYKWPQYSVHRGQLQVALLEAVRERLGPQVVRTGRRVMSVDADSEILKVSLRDSEGTDSVLWPALLIGADGIRSTVRNQLFPASRALAWNGWVMWRGVTASSMFLDGSTMVIIGDEVQRVVVYPIRPADGGKPMLNWILSRRGPDTEADHGNWNRAVDSAKLLPFVAGWCYDWLDVAGLIRDASVVYEYPMVDLDSLPCWTRGGATLLGDAAHAMYPFGSNGASQAIIDARVLAFELATAPDRLSALANYEGQRREATARIQQANRRQASEVMARVSQFARAQTFGSAADELMSVERDYKRLAGFEAESLNVRASWSVTRSTVAAP